jgi:hypothetical protein
MQAVVAFAQAKFIELVSLHCHAVLNSGAADCETTAAGMPTMPAGVGREAKRR